MEKIEIGRCRDCKWWVEGPDDLDLDQCDYDAELRDGAGEDAAPVF